MVRYLLYFLILVLLINISIAVKKRYLPVIIILIYCFIYWFYNVILKIWIYLTFLNFVRLTCLLILVIGTAWMWYLFMTYLCWDEEIPDECHIISIFFVVISSFILLIIEIFYYGQFLSYVIDYYNVEKVAEDPFNSLIVITDESQYINNAFIDKIIENSKLFNSSNFKYKENSLLDKFNLYYIGWEYDDIEDLFLEQRKYRSRRNYLK
jgi:hypothetical protein